MKAIMKKILTIVVCCLMAAVLFIGCAFVYYEHIHAETVDTRISPDGRFTLALQQIGSPGWPFGSVTVQITLKNGRKTTGKQRVEVYNDGAALQVWNWDVAWHADRVVITVDLGETGETEIIVFPLDWENQ